MLRVLSVALGFVIFYGIGAFLGWFVLPIVRLVTWDRIAGQKRSQRIVARTFRLMLWYIWAVGGYTTGVFERDGSPRPSHGVPNGAVVIANHPSLLDVVMLKAMIGHGVIVVKPVYYFNPFLGFLPWCCGYIRAGYSLSAGMRVIQEAVDSLREGATILLFPEGTRSPTDGLNRFHRGAFRMAEEANAPLAPFWITCDPRVLGKGQGLRGYPKHRVKLDVFPLWEKESDFVVTNARAAASQWEARYKALHAEGGLRRST